MSGEPELILASSSPRRQALLSQLGVRFIVKPCALDEISKPAESAQQFVERMARAKAEATWRLCAQRELPVLGADTVVVVDDTIFGKPATCEDALAMLERLSGRTHRVLTAVVVMNATRRELRLCQTLVTLRSISQGEALRYWNTGEPLDKAGGYAIQGFGAAFVSAISGSYSGVVGLPLAETWELLQLFDISCWMTP